MYVSIFRVHNPASSFFIASFALSKVYLLSILHFCSIEHRFIFVWCPFRNRTTNGQQSNNKRTTEGNRSKENRRGCFLCTSARANLIIRYQLLVYLSGIIEQIHNLTYKFDVQLSLSFVWAIHYVKLLQKFTGQWGINLAIGC